MNRLIDEACNPTGLDSWNNYAGQLPDQDLFVLLGRNRDSDLLSESNWDCAIERLGEENIEIVRFGHWACGWIEYLCIRGDNAQFDEAQEIESELDAYPVLDEDDYSTRQYDEANRVWEEYYDTSERIDHIRENQHLSDFSDYSDLFSCVKGEYFTGSPCELGIN